MADSLSSGPSISVFCCEAKVSRGSRKLTFKKLRKTKFMKLITCFYQ